MEPTNEQRAQWAQEAINASATSDSDYALIDLLSDLMHWADANGRDFDQDLDQARTHYEQEREGA